MFSKLTVGTDPEKSIVTGRNGTRPLAALELWFGCRGELFIDGVGKSGKVLNAGFMVDAEAAKAIATAFAEEITIEISVEGGLIQDIKKPDHIKVIVRDYDDDFCDEERLEKDSEGRDCVVSEW